MSEEDQEIILDRSLKKIKAQAFHIRSSIEKNNLRQCLKETYTMLTELRSTTLTPKNYYHLYIAAFDEMQYISNYFKEEIKRGRRIKDLYESVQQAKTILPRIYLLITAGAIYMETQVTSCKKIIFNLLQMVKGIQNPIRGLFTRYYLLKMIKDKLPDEGNEFETETGTMKDTMDFILQNLEEMNRLWIRLSTNVPSKQRQVREKERIELKVLVGENIIRLSSLNGLKLNIYKNEVLPKMIDILIESKDVMSQQYLMECIIHAFPDEYNINCIDELLVTLDKMDGKVDVKSLYIALMNKLARFVSDNKENEEMNEVANTIFGPLKESISKHIQMCNNIKEDNDIAKLIELEVAFIKFTISCCSSDEKLETVNHIFSSCEKLLSSLNQKLSKDSIKQISNLLSIPLESNISIFNMSEFPSLMNYLDYTSRTTLSKRIIDSIISPSNSEVIESVDKIKHLLSFIQPLLEDLPNATEISKYQFEEEQTAVAKLVFSFHSSNPSILLEMYTELKNVFINGGPLRKKYTLPSLANAIIVLCNKISNAYDSINGNLPLMDNSSSIHNEFISSLDISFIQNGDIFYEFLFKVYTLLNDVITSIEQDAPEIALKMYLNAINHINCIYTYREKFEEACASFLNTALSIYQEGKYAVDKKIDLLCQICGVLMKNTLINKDMLLQIVPQLQQSAATMLKRNDQCVGMLYLSDLYYWIFGDKIKVMDCLKKAKRYADFSMTNASNLYLFVIILNKVIYFIELGIEGMVPIAEDVIETVKNHIETIKYDKKGEDFLPEIENYFENTIQVIRNRKEVSDKREYSEINLGE